MSASVLRTLVEFESRDGAVFGRLEFHTEFYTERSIGIVTHSDRAWRIGLVEQAGVAHCQSDICRRGVLAIGDGVSEARWSCVVAGRHEADGLRVRIIADRAVARVTDARDGQRETVRIRVIGEQRRCRDRQGRVRDVGQSVDVLGRRRLV